MNLIRALWPCEIQRGHVKNAMTAEELKAKRLAQGFRSRNALAKALGVSKYAVEHWEYGRRAIPGWVPRFLQCLENLHSGQTSESNRREIEK
jgi:DNA-binding transcriptional regulator YiaG